MPVQKYSVERIDDRVIRLDVPMVGHALGQMNSYIVVGRESLALIDVGWHAKDYALRLDATLRSALGRSIGDVTHVLVTHSHADHCGAVGILRATAEFECAMSTSEAASLRRRYFDLENAELAGREWLERVGAPDWAVQHVLDHAKRTAVRITQFAPDFSLAHGDVLSIGDLRLRAVETPGHSTGHLSYALDERSLLFTGDHLLASGTAGPSFMPPISDGDLRTSLASLSRLREFRGWRGLPGHGPEIGDIPERVAAVRVSHERRMTSVREALARGSLTTWQIAERLPRAAPWAELSTTVQVAAAGQVLAYLIGLEATGEVLHDGPLWAATRARLALAKQEDAP